MELPVQITYRNMDPSDAVTARIETEAAKLDKFFPRITSCRVVVEVPHRTTSGANYSTSASNWASPGRNWSSATNLRHAPYSSTMRRQR